MPFIEAHLTCPERAASCAAALARWTPPIGRTRPRIRRAASLCESDSFISRARGGAGARCKISRGGTLAAECARVTPSAPTSMLPENPIIFLLEDCPNAAFVIERIVLKEIPSARLLWAQSLQEARMRADGLEIEIFLTDINLPDGNGLDFLWEMAATHPLARAIVMTATPLPEHEATTAALGVVHYIGKPLNMPLFVTYLLQALGTELVSGGSDMWRASTGDAALGGSEKNFRATLANLSVIDIIQLKCLTGVTTLIEFRSGGLLGSIKFDSGEIVDAAAGALRGVEAVFEIVKWQNGDVTEQPVLEPGQRTIHGSWHALLMEASHQLDERVQVIS